MKNTLEINATFINFAEQIANGPSRPNSPSEIALDMEEPPPPMDLENMELLVRRRLYEY